jgi:molybdopterin molybdotransferase
MSLPGCDDNTQSLLTVEQALESITSEIHAVEGKERLTITASLGRVLAEQVIAPFDVPPHRNSAMDGYAIRYEDLDTAADTQLKVIGKSFAGQPFDGSVNKGEVVRIMTGAVVPTGADTVVMQEHVQADGDHITLSADHKLGQNIRHPGEDMKQGAQVLQAGRIINAADIGLMASLGIAEITVRRKPRVVIFSTGDELRGIGENLGEGDIYDSNRYTLRALLSRLNIDLIDMGVIRDDPQAIGNALQQAAETADMVITSGGVSVGEADFVKQKLDELGKVGFWKIAMKPGKPLAFGKLGKAFFLGLPGNPVSVMATFILFARPAIQLMQGTNPESPLRLRARLSSDIRKQPGRRDYQRGIFIQNPDGTLEASNTGIQGSHMLSSMSQANCFIVIPQESGSMSAGEEVEVIPFNGLI